MTEQLGVNRTLRDSSAVDGNILPVLPPAVLMDNLRKALLSHTALSGDQHGQIGRSYLNGNIDGT